MNEGAAAPSWNADQYSGKHAYVWQLGAALIDLLDPQPGEHILDLGCGTGQLTAQIADRGALVTGFDKSAAMLEQARRSYPHLKFVEGDAAAFHFDQPFDAVFSNATLHWVKDAEAAVVSIARALRPGGRFVAEFGGKGNNRAMLEALRHAIPDADARNPWFYPSIGEYAPLLERDGLEVRQASLFDRPTPVERESAMEDWFRMFCGAFFEGLTPQQTNEAIQKMVAHLRPQRYRAGVWNLDYRRLRMLAVKVSPSETRPPGL